MIHGKGLVIDKDCKVYEELAPIADMYFYDFNILDIKPNTIYVISKKQFVWNLPKIKEILDKFSDVVLIFSDPYEGSETMEWHIPAMNLDDIIHSKQVPVICCGDLDERFYHLRYDSLLPRVYNTGNNKNIISDTDKIYQKPDKPYKFLFLNGRARWHRKFLLEKFELSGLLKHSLYTCLEGKGLDDSVLRLEYNGNNLMLRDRPFAFLPKEYEIPEVTDNLDKQYDKEYFVKYDLFNGIWQDGVIYPKPYIDTYFSLVTETVIKYPYSMRTEKIWKPILIGHPWICATNAGFYRDLRNMGFKTFDKLIDESFDQIENTQDRMERLAHIVEDLCRQDLNKFLIEAKEICLYNQQLMIELAPKLKTEFSKRFIDFVEPYCKA